jgi:O-antigen ligase
MSSKGLRKDRAGVMALSDQDIRNVELGFPSVVYAEKHGLPLRIHTFFFSIHQFKQTGNASGLSFFQRTVYWDVASHIIAENFWTGVGTGDVIRAFADMYQQIEPNLDAEFRLRSHNQFLAFFVSFGLIGFLYFIWLFVLAYKERKPDYFAMAFFTIAFLSCLVEDTLETQAGITFFAFFFALLSKPLNDGKIPQTTSE